MSEFLRSTPAQAVIWATVLLILVAVGVYVIQLFRNGMGENQATANELLTKFRGLHEDGAIDPTEFRRIKAVLGDRLNEEFEGAEESGKAP